MGLPPPDRAASHGSPRKESVVNSALRKEVATDAPLMPKKSSELQARQRAVRRSLRGLPPMSPTLVDGPATAAPKEDQLALASTSLRTGAKDEMTVISDKNYGTSSVAVPEKNSKRQKLLKLPALMVQCAHGVTGACEMCSSACLRHDAPGRGSCFECANERMDLRTAAPSIDGVTAANVEDHQRLPWVNRRLLSQEGESNLRRRLVEESLPLEQMSEEPRFEEPYLGLTTDMVEHRASPAPRRMGRSHHHLLSDLCGPTRPAASSALPDPHGSWPRTHFQRYSTECPPHGRSARGNRFSVQGWPS